jgi:nucleotide-binding universal stress UspA family protein
MDTGSPLRRVVAAYDASPSSRVALEQAVELAAAHHLPLHLAGAVDNTDVASTRTAVHALQGDLAEAADAVRARVVGVSTEVRIGAPALALLRGVRAGDLLVVGTHGRRLPARLLLGSVSSRLVRAAEVPVLVAREPQSAAEAPVVVGVDGSATSSLAVTLAALVADALGVPLHALIAVPPPVDAVGALIAQPPSELESAAAVVAEAVAGLAVEYPDLVVTTAVERIDPVIALLAAARTAGLLVVGSHGRGPISGTLLGSVSRAVGRNAACPVLVVRQQQRSTSSLRRRHRAGALTGTTEPVT